MIEVDYGNYLHTQAEWASGLLRAVEHSHIAGDDRELERDLTLAAGDALERASNINIPKIIRFED